MKDRISTQVLANGAIRYAEYDSNGNFVQYHYMLPADEPSEIGTPLNKNTFLKDATAALFGLTGDPTVDDALAWLGKYNEYCWKRRIRYTVFDETKTDIQAVFNVTPNFQSATIRYSSSVTCDISGVHLVSPTTIELPNSETGANDLAALAPCYFSTSADDYASVHFLPVGSTSGTSSTKTVYYYQVAASQYVRLGGNGPIIAKKVTSVPREIIGEWEYLYSTNRNEYPDFGIVDDYEYAYIGIPFLNLFYYSKMETVEYVGTGTYGEDAPNSISFSFVPRFVVIAQDVRTKDGSLPTSHAYLYIIPNRGKVTFYHTAYPINEASFSGYVRYEFDEETRRTITWYSGNNSEYQNNASRFIYTAIGIG